MKKLLLIWLHTFFGKELDLKVKMFHVLAITGVIICIIMTWISAAGGMVASALINLGTGILSMFLLIYSAKSQRYQVCYVASIGCIFFVLFPSLFFSGGGYTGGMPFFFVFAVVFTVYMLEGIPMLFVTAGELVYYCALCIFTYRHPEYVVPFDSPKAILDDILLGLVTVSVALGATMFVQVRMYRHQQRELETAREGAEEANVAKSVFLANMSHEIRTPIHMILSMNELIHRESTNSQVHMYSEKIDQTSKMLLSLVDSVLDVSKIESGKMELLPADYETRELVELLALVGKTQCSRKRLNFQVHVDPEIPPRLCGDLVHIRKIAVNLLSNAAKYTDTGTVTLTLDAEPTKKENEVLLCISVKDTGVGIRKEALGNLFDAFSRADAASHRYIEGTGLGLAIVRELTELMGGTVQVESEYGRGSNFCVKIPQTLAHTLQQKPEQTTRTFRAPKVRVLVVDDNRGNCMVMQALLFPTRMRVDTVESGAECLEAVKKEKYDLILMDYMMPEMNGLETLQQMKKQPDFSVPVIALTADAAAETGRKLLEGGFAAYLTKPVPWPRLQEVLLQHLPADLVQIVSESKSCENGPEQSYLEQSLLPYGVWLNDGLSYFGGSLEEYCSVAILFVKYYANEREKAEQLLREQNFDRLRYLVHALKGKARNLGMDRLANASGQVEDLCANGKNEEAESLMPYVLYLWKQAEKGMQLIIQEKKQTSKEKKTQDADISQLVSHLQQFRRQPALDCIELLLEQETSASGKELLKQAREHVKAFSYDQAKLTVQIYEKEKEGIK